MPDKTLAELCAELYDAKRAEDAAKSKRIEAEEAIAALVETGDNGSKTVDTGAGVKVTVKRGMIYEADVAAIRDLSQLDLPDGVALPVKYVPPVAATYEFDEKAYENMREKAPDVFAKVSRFVTAKPRKVAVTLKLA